MMQHKAFNDAYWRAFKAPPPRDFRRAYALLCIGIYHGFTQYEKAGKKQKPSPSWPLAIWQLLDTKAGADRFLTSAAKALQRWDNKSKSQGQQRAGKPDRVHMATTRKVG